MNNQEEATLTMFRGIEQHLDTNAAVFSTIAALVTAIAAFKAVIADIIGTEQLASVNLTGITTAKGNSRLTLAQIAADIAAVIAAFASATGNIQLEAEVNYSFSKLKRMRDEQLAPICQIIHTRAVENTSALKDYGLTGGKIAELLAAINDYAAKSPNPRTAIGSRKTLVAQRREKFRAGNEILKKQIDKLIKNFRTTNPEIYETYFNLREIKDPSTTVTQLKGIITDSATANPIKGATVTVVELNKSATTDSTGKYSFKPIENGKHTVKVIKEGYQPFENDEVEVKVGDIKHLDVKLTN